VSDNQFGKLFAVSTFGESHGPAIGCVIDGCPPGIEICAEEFAADLFRRTTGKNRHTSQRHEADVVEILSGVYQGQTTGTPIALLIRNTDARSKDYEHIAEQFRPGHADYTYHHKYGVRDPRGGGRSSARETTMRVAAAVIAKKWLYQKYGIAIHACVNQIAHIKANNSQSIDWMTVESNPFFWPDAGQVPALEALMDTMRKSGDSVGACVHVSATHVPVGWGQPIYGKIDVELAAAMMSINAVKAVSIGAGFDCVTQWGSAHRDLMTNTGFLSNHAGGILGGISTGQEIICQVAFKPTSSLRLPAQSLNHSGETVAVITTGRHDPCVALRAPPICEAMMALTLMDLAMRHRAQCGDVPAQMPVVGYENK
jgi:chorismate synthase